MSGCFRGNFLEYTLDNYSNSLFLISNLYDRIDFQSRLLAGIEAGSRTYRIKAKV